jgi:crossover junction endodeoxyribonuclease RuvC
MPITYRYRGLWSIRAIKLFYCLQFTLEPLQCLADGHIFMRGPVGKLAIIGAMRVLGIDPGLGRVGFGLLEIDVAEDGQSERFGDCQWGIIATSKDKPDGRRLEEIHEDLTGLIAQLQPDVVSLERLFYFRNATTLVPVAQARGVILMIISRFNLPVYEYTPMQVKQAITGYGKSEKREIQEMLVGLLNLEKKPTPDDAADALALSVCHYNHVGRVQFLQARQQAILS